MAPSRHLAVDRGRLYRLPLAEFTAARNTLAAELAAAGRRPEAEEARRLAKATPSAWAVTRLFAEEREAMRDLLRAGERARAPAGGPRVRAALDEAVRRVEELRGRAAQVLAAAGHAAGDAYLGRVADSLRALAFDPQTAAVAARGWLDRDLEPPGFDLLAGLELAARPSGPPAAAPSRPASGPRSGKTRVGGRAAAAADAARAAGRRAALAAAEREVEQAASRADFQRRRAERAAVEAEAAAARAEEAKRQTREARASARSAARATEEAEAVLAAARRALAAAREE